MPYIAESEPLTVFRNLLEDNWVEYKEIPKPIFVITNNPEEAIARIDLNRGDYIVIRIDAPESIKYRGNIQYYDRIFSIVLDLWTKKDRQRLRDIWKTVKAICLDKKHNFSGYQLIRLNSYAEMTTETLNIWRGIIRLTVESHGVAAESLL